MTSPRMLTLLGVLTIIGAGCGSNQEKTADLERKLGDADRRVAELTASVAKLQQELDALKGGDLQKTVKDLVAKEVQSQMSADIGKIVSAQVEKRVGSDDEMNARIRGTVQEEVDAAEARRQDGRQPGSRGQQNWAEQRQRWESQRLDNVAKDLKLNDDQKKQLGESQTAIQKKAMEGARKLMESGNADPTTILNGIKQLQAEHFAAVRTFLTDEQYQSYTNRQNNMFNFFGMGGGAGGGDMRFRQMRAGGRNSQAQPQVPPPPAPIQ